MESSVLRLSREACWRSGYPAVAWAAGMEVQLGSGARAQSIPLNFEVLEGQTCEVLLLPLREFPLGERRQALGRLQTSDGCLGHGGVNKRPADGCCERPPLQ